MAITRETWTDDSGGPVPDGDVIDNAELQKIYDSIDDFVTDWSNYTPTWTTTGTAPSLGDGTIAGRFAVINTTIVARIKLTLGSSTTVGTGAWNFTLPATAASGSIFRGSGEATDTGTATYAITATMINTTQCRPMVLNSSGTYTVTEAVAPTAPFSWAVGDTLEFNIIYEGA